MFLGLFSFKMYEIHIFSSPQAKKFKNRKKMYHFLVDFSKIFGLRPKIFEKSREGDGARFFQEKNFGENPSFSRGTVLRGTIQKQHMYYSWQILKKHFLGVTVTFPQNMRIPIKGHPETNDPKPMYVFQSQLTLSGRERFWRFFDLSVRKFLLSRSKDICMQFLP